MGERKIWGTDNRQEHGVRKKGLGQPREELKMPGGLVGWSKLTEKLQAEWLFSTLNSVRGQFTVVGGT